MELVGEVNRLEPILEAIEGAFSSVLNNPKPDHIKRTMNSSESIARGAVLFALRASQTNQVLPGMANLGDLTEHEVAQFQQVEDDMTILDSRLFTKG